MYYNNIYFDDDDEWLDKTTRHMTNSERHRMGCIGCVVGWILIVLLLLFMASLSSCRTARTVIVTVRDSTETHVHTQTVFVPDTIPVVLPPQTVYVTTPDTASHIETDYAYSDAAVIGGLLHHSIANKNTPVLVPVAHKETVRDSIVYREREVPVPVPVEVEVEKPLTWWQQTRLRLANIMLGLIAVFAAGWFIKKKFMT